MKIYTLVIDHRHGTDIYNFLSEAEMNDQLYAYVKDRWHEEDGSIDAVSRGEAIESYFHQNYWCEDWYKVDYTDFPVLSDLLTAIKDTYSAAIELAKERDPDQLGLWDALFASAKKAISKVETRAD